MRMPKPRLRQVFEHSTHFKVVSPGGKTITIAKKPLSQGMLGRLRRFAQGGEVQNFQIGGEALPADIARQPDVDAAMAAAPVAQPVEEEAAVPSTGRRAVRATEATGVPQTAEQQAAADLERLRQEEAARRAAMPAPAPVAPAAVTVKVEPAAAPAAPAAPAAAVEPEKKSEPAKAEAKPAGEAPEPAAPARRVAPVGIKEVPLPPAPAAEEAVPPGFVRAPPPAPGVVIPAPPPAPVAPTAPPIGSFLGKPGLLVSPLAPPVLAQTPAAESVAAPVPAAAPVAAVAPTTPPPEAFKRVTPEEVKAKVEATKGLDYLSAARELVGPLPLASLDIKDVTNLANLPASEMRDKALAAKINALKEQAGVEYKAAEEEARLKDEEHKQNLALAAQHLANQQALHAQAEAVRKDAEANDDIKSFWGGLGLWRSVLGIASLLASGYATGYTGQRNFAMEAFDKAVDRDLEEQKRKRTRRWEQYKTITGDEKMAELLYKADTKEVAAVELERMAARNKTAAISPKFNNLIADLLAASAKERELLAVKETLAEAAETRAGAAMVSARRPAAVRAPAAPKPTEPKPPSMTQQLALERFETGRTINVGTVPVQRNSPVGAAGADVNLGNRNFAANMLAKATKLLEDSTLTEMMDFTGDEKSEAIATLAYLVENFPQAFGYTRAVSVNAATQLKTGLQNPTEFKNALTYMAANLAGGDRELSTGVKKLYEDTRDSRRSLVKQFAAAGSARDKEAAEYGLWQLESDDLKAMGKKPEAQPKLTFAMDDITQTPYQRARASGVPLTGLPAPAVPTAAAAAPAAPTPAATTPPPSGAAALLRRVRK